MKILIKAGVFILVSSSFSTNATQVFDLEGFGPVSRSMGGTSASFYTGNAALVANPATLSFAPEGKQLEVGVDLVTTDIEVTNDGGETAESDTASNNRGPYYAPQLSFVAQNENWRIGTGLFANGGLGTEYGTDSFLSRTENGTQTDFENSSRLLVLRAPVGFSYQASPELTLGASADIVWTSLNLEVLLPASQVGALAANGDLSGGLVGPLAQFVGTEGGAHFSLTKDNPVGGGVDSVGLGGRLGLTYRLSEQTTLGVMYNLKTSVGDLEGKAMLWGIDGAGNVLPLQGDIRFKDFEMPASLALGLAHQLNESWLITADIKRTYWSDVFKDINVSFTSAEGDIDITLPQNYQDITVVSLGTAYRYSNSLTLRAGFSYAQQAQDNDLILPVIPAYLKKHISLGGEYRFDRGSSLNVAVSFGLKESLRTPSYLNGSETLSQSHSQVNAVVSYTHRF